MYLKLLRLRCRPQMSIPEADVLIWVINKDLVVISKGHITVLTIWLLV